MKPNLAFGLCSSQLFVGENRFLFPRLKVMGKAYPKLQKGHTGFIWLFCHWRVLVMQEAFVEPP